MFAEFVGRADNLSMIHSASTGKDRHGLWPVFATMTCTFFTCVGKADLGGATKFSSNHKQDFFCKLAVVQVFNESGDGFVKYREAVLCIDPEIAIHCEVVGCFGQVAE